MAGAALYLNSTGNTQLLYVTIGIRNMIIANHTIGLQTAGGAINQDYTLFHGTLTKPLGVSITGGLNNVSGDPQFMDAAHDNYHLTASSVAIDKGMNLGNPIDFDGDLRPFGNGFDIRFDEYTIHHLYLPLVRK
ncbi:MAG TPA: hypothetical protein VFF59_08280 [Anaerolineae bacterium]|nr:hypothetical protein [Anaerolineae bacterium]